MEDRVELLRAGHMNEADPQVWSGIRDAFADALGLEEDEVELEHKIIADLEAVGVNLQAESQGSTGGETLSGKTFVVTGSLEKYTRDEMHDLISQHGGRATSSVSKKTEFLVAGQSAGSKLQKAKELGVEILSEADFSSLLKQ